MHALSNNTRLPLYQRLHDHLAQQIVTNHWRPGEAIPTEAALSTEHRLSTGTVRKAVDALVNEGLLESQQGRCTFVRRPQFQSSLFRFFRFQTAAGERQIPESRIFSIEPLSAPLEVAQALGLSADAPVVRIIRVRVFACSMVSRFSLRKSGYRLRAFGRFWTPTSLSRGHCST